MLTDFMPPSVDEAQTEPEPRIEPTPLAPPTPALNPLAGIIANASANQRKRDEEKKLREREAKEASARFALD